MKKFFRRGTKKKDDPPAVDTQQTMKAPASHTLSKPSSPKTMMPPELSLPAISMILDHLSVEAPKTKGVFRESGEAGEINAILSVIEEELNTPRPSKRNPLQSSDTLAAADALKRILSNMPNPLIPSDLYPDFIKVGESGSSDSISTLQNLVGKIVPEVRKSLHRLLHLLHQVSLNKNVTLMGVENLGTVFGLALLRPDPKANIDEHINVRQANAAVALLIQDYEEIFGPYKDKSGTQEGWTVDTDQSEPTPRQAQIQEVTEISNFSPMSSPGSQNSPTKKGPLQSPTKDEPEEEEEKVMVTMEKQPAPLRSLPKAESPSPLAAVTAELKSTRAKLNIAEGQLSVQEKEKSSLLHEKEQLTHQINSLKKELGKAPEPMDSGTVDRLNQEVMNYKQRLIEEEEKNRKSAAEISALKKRLDEKATETKRVKKGGMGEDLGRGIVSSELAQAERMVDSDRAKFEIERAKQAARGQVLELEKSKRLLEDKYHEMEVKYQKLQERLEAERREKDAVIRKLTSDVRGHQHSEPNRQSVLSKEAREREMQAQEDKKRLDKVLEMNRLLKEALGRRGDDKDARMFEKRIQSMLSTSQHDKTSSQGESPRPQLRLKEGGISLSEQDTVDALLSARLSEPSPRITPNRFESRPPVRDQAPFGWSRGSEYGYASTKNPSILEAPTSYSPTSISRAERRLLASYTSTLKRYQSPPSLPRDPDQPPALSTLQIIADRVRTSPPRVKSPLERRIETVEELRHLARYR